jgi:Domain of unknown function (DUF4136)
MNRASRLLPIGAALCMALAQMGVAGEQHDVSFAAGVDFRALKTFAIATAEITSSKPEIDNRLFRQRMEEAIRTTLIKKGMREVAEHADFSVQFSFHDQDVSAVQRTRPTRLPDTAAGRGSVIPGTGPTPVLYTEGTLVIDINDASASLLWRGTWRDREQSGPQLSRNLSEDARKLLADFPPRRR